jgi:hypothetical protein
MIDEIAGGGMGVHEAIDQIIAMIHASSKPS